MSIVPDPVDDLSVKQIMAKSLELQWKASPKALSFHILISKDKGRTYKYVHHGEGYESPLHSLMITFLKPDTLYYLKIYSGNRFEYETQGRIIQVKTLTRSEEKGKIFFRFWLIDLEKKKN
jgi:hypothetical protein